VAIFLAAALADDPRRSHALLARAPDLAAADLHTACAAIDAARAEAILARDPPAATRRGGPCDAQPLWTLCHSNLHLEAEPARAARLAIARRLLALGADPDARATRDSDFGPFSASALYGTIARNQPGLTELLLQAGADPNDGESLYHATEHRDGRCLRALLAHAPRIAGTHALAHALDYPDPEPVRWLLEAGADPGETGPRGENALQHAARRGRGAVAIDLLLRHGAALDAESAEGRTAYAIARRHGNQATAELLRARGASDALSELDRCLAACAAGDEPAARARLAQSPGWTARLSAEDHGLLVEAARLDHREAVRLMLDLGFPIEANAAFDWSGTALNHAAHQAHVAMVELLLARGADPEATNQFGGTALGALLWSSRHPDGVDVRMRSEAERQRDLLACAERLLAAGARILPQHLANASPALAELLRARGAADGEG
jgi:ankyrin repeat protein